MNKDMITRYLAFLEERSEEIRHQLTSEFGDIEPRLVNCIMTSIADAGHALEHIHHVLSGGCPECENEGEDDS